MSIKELYFRDESDTRFDRYALETNSAKETLLNKIRMILLTERGSVMGDPTLGMDLYDYLFDFNLPEDVLRQQFYSQLAKYVPETQDHQIDFNLDVVSLDGVTRQVNIYITIDGQRSLGVTLD